MPNVGDTRSLLEESTLEGSELEELLLNRSFAARKDLVDKTILNRFG